MTTQPLTSITPADVQPAVLQSITSGSSSKYTHPTDSEQLNPMYGTSQKHWPLTQSPRPLHVLLRLSGSSSLHSPLMLSSAHEIAPAAS